MPGQARAFVGARSLVAVATALTLLAACGGGDPPAATDTSDTPALTVAPIATTEATGATPSAASTEPPATVAVTDAPAGSPTTVPATPTLEGETFEIVSPLMANPFTLNRVGEYGELVVYDGFSEDGDFVLRCVAVGRDGEDHWWEWCALPGDSSTFTFVDGADPWIVEVGAEPGDVSLAQQPSDWVATTSGCVDPLTTLLAAADLEPAVATGIACAGGEAFVTYGSVFMQPGPVDGGGMLLTNGDEGWNSDGGGTSIDCAGFTDGIDRCTPFGVESEMFEAVSPLPSPELIPPASEFVGVREVTDELIAELSAAVEPGADVDAISEAIVGIVSVPDHEVEPTWIRHDGVSFDRYSLLVVDVPLPDDSIRSTTWVVWITTAAPETPPAVHRAYFWNVCARGVADAQTCV